MKKIESLLKDNGIDVSTLPNKLQKAIENSQKHYAEWEELNNALNAESTEDEKLEVDEFRETVESFNESILDAINSFMEESKPEPKPEPKPTPTPEPTPHVAPKDEKKGNGVGWAIFGALALVVTLGAVNVMKK